MNFDGLIFSLLDDDSKTLVFTSEVVARSWLRRYAIRTENKTVFLDRAISWDTFKSGFVHPGNLRQVSKLERQIFANGFLKDNYDKLTFFSSRYRESFAQFAGAVASYLPFFAYADSKSADALDDIKKIVDAYKVFLYEHKLFEYNFLEKDYSFLNKNYVLIFPETFNDPIVDEISDRCTVVSAKTIKQAERTLVEYPNSLTEIRSVIRSIAQNIENGTDPNDIAITCACIDLYRPYLEAESAKYDIDLCFTSSRSITSAPQGRFFSCLAAIKEENYSFKSLKALLMDPVFPFKNTEVNKALIQAAIKYRLKRAPRDLWIKTLDDSSYFENLSDRIEDIVSATNADVMAKSIKAFTDEYFAEGAFFFTQNGVYAKCLNLLSQLGLALGDSADLFDIYLQILKGESYVDSARNGIRVYKYPVSAALAVDDHYVIGLDDKNTGVSFDKYPYLPVYKKDQEALELTVKTEDVFSVYSGEILSGTKNGFDGSRLLPVTLNTVKPDENFIDIYESEKALWSGSETRTKFSQYQKKGFERASKILTYEAPKAFTDDKNLQNRNISASQFKDYSKCPFCGYISIYLKPNQLDFEPDYLDNRILGNILHKTIQRSLEEVQIFANLNEEVLSRNLKLTVAEAVANHEVGPKYYQDYIQKKFSGLLPQINRESSFLDNSTLYKNEVSFAKGYPVAGLENVNLVGRIDTILQDYNGFYVIDYKTTNNAGDYNRDVSLANPQVALYARIIRENTDGAQVVGGAYYIIEDGKMRFIWPDKNTKAEDVDFDFERRTERLKQSILSSVFEFSEDEDTCSKCRYSGICRRRFATK